MSTLNSRDLAYFKQLVIDRNYTKTAEHFGVTQPTITYAIKRLEAELAAPLFIRNRSHRELTLTLSGKSFSKHANKILKELETAKADLLAITHEKVRFGLPPIIGTYYFPQLANRLIRADLMAHMDTIEAGSVTLQQQLIDKQLDVALLGVIHPEPIAGIKTMTLAQTKFKIITSPIHHLATQSEIAFGQLKNEPFITLKEGFIHSAAFQQLADKNQFQPNVVYTTPDIDVLKGMVRENVGVGFLTELAIANDQTVHSLALTDADQRHFDIVLAYREQTNPLVKQLVSVLQEPI
ncbi:LysR family transcriptional regulator [Secundilactobacillus malefermentans DSM 5705 = KCTC 3548]|uniref:LysR family transcriptional regulator n=1 Tax=Secundilactobacillus malefermentans TaxID=176292 RepID=UPI0006F09B44|nr:LysR family transcriptional regulator [Secundilactobacillus malefermentans]KRM57545.1 LysR family transcriptional regulator [Secundilactobacillus malefermentans DSM 5705 = KCTC 3548]